MGSDTETPFITIYIVGPSSTGKTTLCSALARRLGLGKSSYITEVARTVMRSRGFTRRDVGTLEMQKAIMEAQLAEEEKKRVMVDTAQGAQALGSRVLLSDRSAVDAIVYAILTSQNKTEADDRWQILTSSGKFQSALPRYRQAKFWLLTPVPEWLVNSYYY
jgi:cytidylate kinase